MKCDEAECIPGFIEDRTPFGIIAAALAIGLMIGAIGLLNL